MDSAREAVAMTVRPRTCFAIWVAMDPTPPAPPTIRMVLPAPLPGAMHMDSTIASHAAGGRARQGKAASHWAGADKHASGPYARRGPGVQGASSTRSLASLQPRTGQEDEGHGSRLCVGEVAGLAAHDPLIDEVVLRVGAGALQRQQQQHDGSTGR